MPYDQKQARAIFLDIKRKKGAEAAKQFGRKHSEYLKDNSKHRGYLSRARRNSRSK